MIKRLLQLAVTGFAQAGVFVLIYYGRLRNVAICHSDFILFLAPFLAATIVYAAVLRQILTVKRVALRAVLIVVLSLTMSAVSETVGMSIAFNLWGT